VGVSVVDHHGAALFAMGVLAALVRRQKTGQGCRVDASLMQAALDLQAESLVSWLNSPHKPNVATFKHVAGWYYAAPYGVYQTRDGHLAVSLSPLKDIAVAIGEPRLAGYDKNETWTKQDEITELIAAKLKTATSQEWTALMEPLKIWHAPVQDYHAIAEDPQVKHMRSLVTVPGGGAGQAPITVVNHPVLYDGASAEVRRPPQPLGAQSREILVELGFTEAEICALTEEAVIRTNKAP
jgi:crotonobetainyl-CoA:carnitine CoA-transferase CaiB-like acyl-CoA transferase